MRIDHQILQNWIHNDSRVLDLGCGDGSLLKALGEKHNVEGYGLEIDSDSITACIANGVNVIQKDLDEGLSNFPDNSFDTVVMTQALQVMHFPTWCWKRCCGWARSALSLSPTLATGAPAVTC